jgi:hypothetical protein
MARQDQGPMAAVEVPTKRAAIVSDTIAIDYIARYSAEPGDKVIVRLAEKSSPTAVQWICDTLKAAFPEQTVIVLEAGTTIEIVNTNDASLPTP